MNGSRNSKLVNGDYAPQCHHDKMALSSRQSHNIPSSRIPPSVIITDHSQNDVKMFSSDTPFKQTTEAMDTMPSGPVRRNGCRTGNTSMPSHNVRWSDPLSNSGHSYAILKVCYYTCSKHTYVGSDILVNWN